MHLSKCLAGGGTWRPLFCHALTLKYQLSQPAAIQLLHLRACHAKAAASAMRSFTQLAMDNHPTVYAILQDSILPYRKEKAWGMLPSSPLPLLSSYGCGHPVDTTFAFSPLTAILPSDHVVKWAITCDRSCAQAGLVAPQPGRLTSDALAKVPTAQLTSTPASNVSLNPSRSASVARPHTLVNLPRRYAPLGV